MADQPGFLHAIEFVRGDGWNDAAYPFNLPVLRRLDLLKLHPGCTFLVGENGSGKSTLVEAIAIALGFNPEGGSRDHGFHTRNTHSALHRFIRPHRSHRRPKDGWFLRAESHYSVSSYLDDVGSRSRHGGRALHEQSHGESIFALLQHRLEGRGLYIFDEPEAGLSPTRQLSLLTRMHDLLATGSQFIVATHSPIVLAYPEAWIYSCSTKGLDQISYEEAELVDVSRSFLNRRDVFLRTLLSSDENA